MNALDTLGEYMFIFLIVGLVLLYLFDLSHPEQVKPSEKVQSLLPENYAVDVTEKLIEAYWQAWEEKVRDD